VVQLVVELIDPRPGHSVYDPTCGSGGMLVESAHHIAALPGGQVLGQPNVQLYGQEKNLGTWAIAKLNLYLHDMHAKIERGDTLVEPKHLSGGHLQTFDRVIANPPFSAKAWWSPLEIEAETEQTTDSGKKAKAPKAPNYKTINDPHSRFLYGTPPRGYGDLAFAQHMLASLKADGRMGIILPHGVLFRGGEEGVIRKQLIENDHLETIIGLPSNIFFGTGIPTVILVLRQKRESSDVLFVDASKGFAKEGKNNKLRACDIKKITDVVIARSTVPGFSRLVPKTELQGDANDYNLNIPRYVDSSEPPESWDLYASMFGGIPLSELDALADVGRLAIDGDAALLDQLLHLQPRAHARLCQHFVELGRVGLRGQHPLARIEFGLRCVFFAVKLTRHHIGQHHRLVGTRRWLTSAGLARRLRGSLGVLEIAGF